MKTDTQTSIHRASLKGVRGIFSLRTICCGLVLLTADLAQAGGLYPYNRKFSPPVHLVRIKLQQTQNGVERPPNCYRLVSVPPQNGVMRIAGTYSEVEYLGAFNSVAEVCRAVPANVSVYEPSQSWLIRAEWYKELQAPKPSQPRVAPRDASAPALTIKDVKPPRLSAGPARARPTAPARQPLPSAGLDPEPPSVGSANGGDIFSQVITEDPVEEEDDNGNRTRPPAFPPLRNILFGAIAPAGAAVSGRYYSLHPDGSIGGILGSFRVEGDRMSMVPAAGNEELRVLLNAAPTATTLDAEYVQYAQPLRDATERPMSSTWRSIGSGDLSFDFSGDTLTASITQKHVTLTDNGPNGVTTQRVASPSTQQLIFIPD